MAEQPIIQIRDFFTGYPVGVTSDHTYIHQAKGYELSGLSPSISAGSDWTISFQTPADKYVHLRPSGIASTANSLQMRIAEGSTITGGSTATPNNRNRNSAKTSGMTIKTGVTLSVEGTVLQYFQVGTGTNASSARGGSADASAEEWVLKRNTVYTFRFQNIGATTATVAYYSMFWYEEEEGI